MQTRFTKRQLTDPDIQRADDILRKCVHCGFCIATCPSYLVTGDERDSPRGRIWLMRDFLEKNGTARGSETAEVTGRHLDRCLTCLSCVSTCPSGVDYMHLVDIGRRKTEAVRTRPLKERLARKVLLTLLQYRVVAWPVLLTGWMTRPLARIMPKSMAALMRAAPRTRPRLDPVGGRDMVYPADAGTEKRGRVALLAGCVQRAINPDINAATIRLLNRRGVEVVVKRAAACCGGLAHHGGDTALAHKQMIETIRAWADETDMKGLDAIIINASGCGTVVKDFGDAMQSSPLAENAARVSALTCDITEMIDRIGLGEVNPSVAQSLGGSVVYHSACSMQHGQRLDALPKKLLTSAGFTIRTPLESHICCGSAGIYNALEPKIAGELRERKIGHLDAAEGVVIATGNLGCMNQLADAKAPLVHTVQLLDWATGGPPPKGMGSRPPAGK